jgi:hypothetical protein
MSGLYFLLPTLLLILLSFLVVRASAIALTLTGMNEQRARFQALSAFTGTGFTTKEAEFVVNHPQRRRIVSWLMILGNAGVITVIVGATTSIVNSEGIHLPISIVALIVGIFLVYKLASRQNFIRRWERFMESRFLKWRAFQSSTAEELFLLMEDYGLMRVIVTENSPFLNDDFLEAVHRYNAIFILGIERGHRWISLPGPQEIIDEGDRLIVYGRVPAIQDMLKKGTDAE